MSVSAKSIIHYTKKIDALKGIISDGFKIKYCLEELNTHELIKLSGAYPMVSFCDIPLSSIKDHIKDYGSYGIGLSKKWASSKKINPVLYIENNSSIGKSISDYYNKVKHDHFAAKEKGKQIDFEYRNHLFHLLAFCKNYIGDTPRKKNHQFYNEREWRFLPPKEMLGELESIIWGETYENNKDDYNKKIQHLRLEFAITDITYIMVKHDKEIAKLIKFIREKYSREMIASDKIDILLPKIISAEQLKKDF